MLGVSVSMMIPLLTQAWLSAVTNEAWAQEDSKEAQRSMIDHSTVRQLLQAKNAKQALKASQVLRDTLDCPQRVPLSEELAMIWLHRGYANQLLGEDEAVQLAWEQAFSMSPQIQFDAELLVGLTEGEQENILNRFEQVRGLVEAQGVFDPNIPEQLGEAKIFVDGHGLSSGQGVKSGDHLAQIVCPKDGLQSTWTTFEQPLDWFAMCTSGVDVSQTVEQEDFFGADLFGESEDTSIYYNPEAICHSKSGFSLNLPSFSLPTLPDTDPMVLWTMAGGSGLVLTGAISYYAWVVPSFDAVLEAREMAKKNAITVSEAQTITQQFNRARYTTLGLLATGTVLTGYGSFMGARQVYSGGLQPIILPNGLVLQGSF